MKSFRYRHKAGVNYKYLIKDKTRKTTTKTRISGSISTSITQQIVRIDRQTKEEISKETETLLIENIKKAIPEVDAVILSDYHIGTLTRKVIEKTIEIANRHKKIIVVDAQKHLECYKNITSMTPNLPDTQQAVGFFVNNDEDLKKAGDKLLRETRAKSILITCGADGMFVTEPNRKYTKIPVFNKSEVFDVTGAGDTVTAVYTLALAAGADSVMSAYEKFGKYNSRMVLVAVGTNKREIDVLGLTFGQKSITGSGGYSHEDVMDVMKIMKSKKWDIEKLITQEYHLEELSKAIEKAADVDNALNVIIKFDILHTLFYCFNFIYMSFFF